MSRRALLGLVLAAVVPLATTSARAADGPGLPNLAYPPADVGKVIGTINGSLGAPRGHGTLA
ncbi:MAG: hypothetical protein ABI175_17985, partial [Polyangiales bacterium]